MNHMKNFHDQAKDWIPQAYIIDEQRERTESPSEEALLWLPEIQEEPKTKTGEYETVIIIEL